MEKNGIGMDAEVSLRIDRLLYIVLRQWRAILKGAFLMALVFSLAAALINVIGFYSAEQREQAGNKYEIALFSYETKGETLRNDIQNLYDSLNRQKVYNANSLLMQIDPYNKYEAAVTYYVDTGYQIMPEYQYQNIDYGPRLVQLYAEYMNGGEMFSELAQKLSGVSDVRYIEELCEISAHHSMGMIELRICAPSQSICREMLDLIAQGIQVKHEEAAEQIGVHTLTRLNETIAAVVDTQLDETQKKNIQAIADGTQALEEKQEELRAWEREEAPEAPYAMESVIKGLLKAALLGALLGALLMMSKEALCYAASDRVVGVPEFRDRFDLNVLGELPQTGRKHCIVDRWVDRIGGVRLRASDLNALAAVAAENICMAAKSTQKPVALIGSVPKEELAQIAAVFQRSISSGPALLAAGNPLRCAAAAQAIQQAGAVVLVEKQGSSTYTQITELCRQMKIWGVNVLGIVFTDVDARDE